MTYSFSPSEIIYVLSFLGAMGVVVFTLLNRSRVSPSLAIFGRWSRWVFIASSVAVMVDLSGYQRHPIWVIAVVAFLGWFLLESIYIWLAVGALSRSNMPLFPRYEENTRGDEWPSQERFIHLRAWLRRQGYQRVQALFARLDDHVLMRVSVYETADKKTRLSVLFFPNARGQAATAFSLHSMAADGVRLVTDNIFLPFGGFYPENWYLERKPWTRSLARLHQRHLARCDAYGTEFEPFDTVPLNDFNKEQRHLEQLNRELGFLTQQGYSRSDEDEDPERITSAGRFRVWVELWTLSYFGRPRRY